MRLSLKVLSCVSLIIMLNTSQYAQPIAYDYKPETKPWTYWWWFGSAVDSSGIKYNLQKFAQSGIGGVHIIPIYGVKGYEDKFINFLSAKWVAMLEYTSEECKRLGLGLDMTAGTGWPFGGPQVKPENASAHFLDTVIFTGDKKTAEINISELASRLSDDTSRTKLFAVETYRNGKTINLLPNIKDNRLFISDELKNSRIYFIWTRYGVQLVKRAAPGGEGFTTDPFNANALAEYFKPFDEAFKDGNYVRSFYHDSYEYYGADFETSFFDEFKKKRGYNLLDELPYLFTNEDENLTERMWCDYRNTMSELHEEYIKTATKWAHTHGAKFRDQAHGAPANLLDVYAAADIPETEVFGNPVTQINGLKIDTEFSRKETIDPLLLKFASSAAHVTNKNLISSETGTWLTEHFRETLSLIKPEIDLLFVSGINHIFFHGIPYSPPQENWPGWQFYAATDYGPNGSLWHNLPALNNYIARCQSVLQLGQANNDILLYFPVWDLWSNNKKGLIYFQMHNPDVWLFNTSFYNTAKTLTSVGYGVDYFSDKQLSGFEFNNGRIVSGKNTYKAICIPYSKYIPVETLEKLYGLAKQGAAVYFINELPKDAAGYFNYKEKQKSLDEIKTKLNELADKNNSNVFITDTTAYLKMLPQINEAGLAAYGLKFIKRKLDNGVGYFIVNQNAKPVDASVELAVKCKCLLIENPLNGRSGLAEIKSKDSNHTMARLQIESGSSLILKAYDENVKAERWEYLSPLEKAYDVNGEWHVKFLDGGPALPKERQLKAPALWTDFNDTNCNKYFGSALYSVAFNNPAPQIKYWRMDLGKVCNSARIRLNGIAVDTLWCFPFKTSRCFSLNKGINTIEIEVTNSAANRIKDVDINGVDWKKFYDINFVDINYKKFNAAGWTVTESGLQGPVKLIPVEIK